MVAAAPASPNRPACATVALIPPVLPGVAVKPLGYNNGYVDRDGILRRYRYFERLDDGGMIQSLPMSVVQQVDPQAHVFWLERFLNKPQKITTDNATEDDVLINWRKKANSYPHVNFADVFALADGAKAQEEVPSFAGKIVINERPIETYFARPVLLGGLVNENDIIATGAGSPDQTAPSACS